MRFQGGVRPIGKIDMGNTSKQQILMGQNPQSGMWQSVGWGG